MRSIPSTRYVACKAQYVGLSHIHLRQQLAPRIWYAGSLSRCDYSEVEDKGYNLVTLNAPELRPDLSDLDVEFRLSPTRRMVELHAVYEDGELRLPDNLDPLTLKDSRVKVVVTVPNGPDRLLSREQQENLREKLLGCQPRRTEGEDRARCGPSGGACSYRCRPLSRGEASCLLGDERHPAS